jgi:hypothetical protein
MKSFSQAIVAIAFTTLTLGPVTYAADTIQTQPLHQQDDEINFSVNFSLTPDGREWKPGNHQNGELDNLKLTMQQYLPENQPKVNPAEFFLVEKIEIHSYPQPNFLDDFYKSFTENFSARIQEKFPNSPFEFKILAQNEDSLLAEFSVDTPELKEHGWFRIITKDNYDIAVLLYGTRELDKVEAMRKTWISILNNATITTNQKN